MLQATAALWAVLTPVQCAHLAVGCPAPVNMLQLADTLAVATGQPSAQAVLAELAEHLAGGFPAYAPCSSARRSRHPCVVDWSQRLPQRLRCRKHGVQGQVPTRRFPQSTVQLSVDLKNSAPNCSACHRCHNPQNASTTIMLNHLNHAHAAYACTGSGAAGPEAGGQKPKWREVASLLEMCSS